MKNYIELKKELAEYKGMELWAAKAHNDGNTVEGFALVGPEDSDFYESDPRELDDITTGLRLPAYMPGHKPEK